VQGQAYAAYTTGRNMVAAGIGANFEPLRARTGDLSDHRAGHGGFGEKDVWTEAAGRFHGGDATLGVATAIQRPDHGRAGLLTSFTTVEFYGRVRLTGIYLSPSIDAHWDVDRVQGVYLEPTIRLPVLGNPQGAPFWAFYLSARAGINLGQQPDPARPSQHYYYARRGLTHVDLGANFILSRLVPARALDAQLDVHFQFNHDSLTKQVHLNGSPSEKMFRFGLILSWPAYSGRSP
jgi:hypothetical protein